MMYQPITQFRKEVKNYLQHIASGQKTPFRKKLKTELIITR
jgi:hypothetical protein